MLFKLDRVGKEYDGQWLFRNCSVQCNPGDKIGLIGDNGVGKTTLFDLLENRIPPDEGSIEVANRVQFARVEQIPSLEEGRTVLEHALSVFRCLYEMENRLRHLEEIMAGSSDLSPSVSDEYAKLQNRFSMEGGFDFHSRTEKVLEGLGFSREDFQLPCRHLSGGQASRLELARALLQSGNFLLLDEPTNHLDLQGILWLTRVLRESDTAFVVISHDRRFLDQVTGRTWEIESGRLWDYPVSFTRSRKQREERILRQLREYERQQEWKRKTEDFIRRNIVGQKTRQAQARRLQLEKTVWLEKPTVEPAPMSIPLREGLRGGAVTMELRDADIGYGNRPLIRGVNLAIYRGDRIGVLGGNGSGKTTLLKTLLGRLPLIRGEIRLDHKSLTGYYAQEAQFPDPEQSIFSYLAGIRPDQSDQALRDHAARFRFRGAAVKRRVRDLSGGERSRLLLAGMLLEDVNTLILDEPTNHLDISGRESLETALSRFSGSLIVVSHDLYFLRRTVNRFLLILSRSVEEYTSPDQVIERLTGPDSRRSGNRKPRDLRPRPNQRNGISKNEIARLKKKLEKVEADIHVLEKRRAEIEKEIHSGLKDHQTLRRLSVEFQAIEEELETRFQSWEDLTEQLDAS